MLFRSEIYMVEGADFGNVVKSSPDDVRLARAGGICSSDNGGIDSGAMWGMEAAWSDPVGRAGGGGVTSCAKGVSGDGEVLAMSVTLGPGRDERRLGRLVCGGRSGF